MTILFWTSIIALTGLITYLASKQIPQVGSFFQQLGEQINQLVNPGKRVARLNKVVCYHCNRGRGILNPNYLTIHGNPHIEGNCTHCGNFITVRLR